jgi:sodium/proline symporter
VLSLHWPRMTRNGALAGMLVGGLTVILWKQGSGGIFELYEMVPGVVFSTLTIFLISHSEREFCDQASGAAK